MTVTFPHGSGEIAKRLRATSRAWLGSQGEQDTEATADLPAAIRGVLQAALDSPQPILIVWGAEHIVLYNDSFIPFIADHPQAFGCPVAVTWPAIRAEFSPLIAAAYTSDLQHLDDVAGLLLRRIGRRAASLAYACTPLRDETGKAQGFVCALTLPSTSVAPALDTALAALHRRDAEHALRSQQLETINRAAIAITSERDLAKVTQIAVEAGVALCGAQFGALFYNPTDKPSDGYALYALAGAPRSAFEKFGVPRATTLLGPTFTGQGIVRSDDITQDPRYGMNAPHAGMPHGHLPVRSYLALPVKLSSGETIGGLLFGHPEPGRFSATSETSLTSLAGQVAVAIHNARLFETAQSELQHRRLAEARLRDLNETLEARVAQEIRDRRQAEQALQQAQKMEAIGKLTGGIAHDFNNLLQVVSGNLQLLANDVAGKERATRRLDNAMAAVTRGAKLASQLLAFGRRQPLDPRPVNAGRLVREMEEMFRRAIGDEVALAYDATPDLWNSFIDPLQLENALLNLAINARDAMGGVGSITIRATNIVFERDGRDYVAVEVSDTGSGIDPEILDRIFDPFFSTKPVGQGTGLGLSMVYGFVRQSEGQVQVESRLGEGTTFRLLLPRADLPEPPEPIFIGAEIPGGHETILVVEDDASVRATVMELVGELGYRVLPAEDAGRALDLIESGARVDLLFADVIMPGPLSSPELAKRAQQSLPAIAVLFTSGYDESAVVQDGLVTAGLHLLPKPYTREVLARKLRQVLDGQPEAGRPIG